MSCKRCWRPIGAAFSEPSSRPASGTDSAITSKTALQFSTGSFSTPKSMVINRKRNSADPAPAGVQRSERSLADQGVDGAERPAEEDEGMQANGKHPRPQQPQHHGRTRPRCGSPPTEERPTSESGASVEAITEFLARLPSNAMSTGVLMLRFSRSMECPRESTPSTRSFQGFEAFSLVGAA